MRADRLQQAGVLSDVADVNGSRRSNGERSESVHRETRRCARRCCSGRYDELISRLVSPPFNLLLPRYPTRDYVILQCHGLAVTCRARLACRRDAEARRRSSSVYGSDTRGRRVLEHAASEAAVTALTAGPEVDVDWNRHR